MTDIWRQKFRHWFWTVYLLTFALKFQMHNSTTNYHRHLERHKLKK